jgi:hypothetical protein
MKDGIEIQGERRDQHAPLSKGEEWGTRKTDTTEKAAHKLRNE